jgi:hypothetical protein
LKPPKMVVNTTNNEGLTSSRALCSEEAGDGWLGKIAGFLAMWGKGNRSPVTILKYPDITWFWRFGLPNFALDLGVVFSDKPIPSMEISSQGLACW